MPSDSEHPRTYQTLKPFEVGVLDGELLQFGKTYWESIASDGSPSWDELNDQAKLTAIMLGVAQVKEDRRQ